MNAAADDDDDGDGIDAASGSLIIIIVVVVALALAVAGVLLRHRAYQIFFRVPKGVQSPLGHGDEESVPLEGDAADAADVVVAVPVESSVDETAIVASQEAAVSRKVQEADL